MSKKLPYLVLILLLQSHPVLSDGNLQPGIELFTQADYQQAIESDAGNEDNPEFLYYYGLSLYKTDQAKEALEAMSRAAEIEPQNPDYQYALTLIYLLRINEVNVFRKAGMFGKLKKAMATAADHEPTHLRGNMFYTGWLLYAPKMGGGDIEKGMVYLAKLKLVSEPDWVLMEAGLASRDEEYTRAEELYLKALEMKRSPSSVINIARYYLAQKKYQQAISHANAFNLLPKHWAGPGNCDGHLVLAQAYHYLGDDAAFEEHSKKAIDMTNNKAQKERFEASLNALGD